MTLTEKETKQLRAALQDAVVKCSERCLYQSAKWYVFRPARSTSKGSLTDDSSRAAELLDAIPQEAYGDDDPTLLRTPRGYIAAVFTPNVDEHEASLEALEINKYLLAKTYFDCREYDRCAAVFLPDSLLSNILSPKPEDPISSSPLKEKGPAVVFQKPRQPAILPELSQKSLFLALYAKFMSGEKRKNEDSEMVMGPQDLGTAVNKQLPIVSRYLRAWFEERSTPDDHLAEGSQGWLEYLSVLPACRPYGIFFSHVL